MPRTLARTCERGKADRRKRNRCEAARHREGRGRKPQVTYNHHPLYYGHGAAGYLGDKRPGDVKGQAFFSEWFVLSPRRKPITRNRRPVAFSGGIETMRREAP
jgi:hypothetical protein